MSAFVGQLRGPSELEELVVHAEAAVVLGTMEED